MKKIFLTGMILAVASIGLWHAGDSASAQTGPNVSSLSLSSGPVGTSVTIYGSGFGSANVMGINFGSGDILTTPSNDSTVTFTIPSSVTSCSITNVCSNTYYQTSPGVYYVSVTNSNGTSNGVAFMVTVASTPTPTPISTLTISSLSPTSALAGTSVTISGSGFMTSSNASGNTINFSGSSSFSMTSVSQSGTMLTFVVPSPASVCTNSYPVASCNGLSAGTYNLSVTNANGTSNTMSFTIANAATPTPTPYPTATPYMTPYPTPTPYVNPTPAPANSSVDITTLYGKLIKTTDSPRVYYVTQKGFKRWIPTADIFNSYGDSWSSIVIVDDNTMNAIPNDMLIKLSSSNNVYELDSSGTIHLVSSVDAFNRNGFSWNEVAPVNQTEFNYYPIGQSVN